MRSASVLLLLALAGSVHDFSAADTPCTSGGALLDEKNGFRDVKLGSAVAAVSGLRQIELAVHDRERFKSKDVSAHARASDKLTIFGQRLSSITYLSFKGHIFAIVLRWGEQADGGRILEGFEAAFGCPRTYDLGGSKADVEINATTDYVWFVAWHRVVKNAGSFGEAIFHDRALLQDVNEQIRREAASEL